MDNAFPINVLQHSVSILKIDLSPNKSKLAIVDDSKNLTVFDMNTKEQIFHEMNITSVAFNFDFDDMIAYSGNEMLFVKTSNHPALNQKMSGNVIGFKGN